MYGYEVDYTRFITKLNVLTAPGFDQSPEGRFDTTRSMGESRRAGVVSAGSR